MGKRGPHKTPTPILQLRGSKAAAGRTDPVLPPGEMVAPDWLSGEARAEWDRQVADLRRRGLLCPTFHAALCIYCKAWGDFREADQKVAEMGAVTKALTGALIQNPWVSIRNKSRDAVVKLGREFGFSPATIADTPGNGAIPLELDEFGQFLEDHNGKARFFPPRAKIATRKRS